MGKPQGQDSSERKLDSADAFSRCGQSQSLRALIETQFENPRAILQRAIEIVNEFGLVEAQKLAKREGDIALASLRQLPDSEAKRSLVGMVGYVLERIY